MDASRSAHFGLLVSAMNGLEDTNQASKSLSSLAPRSEQWDSLVQQRGTYQVALRSIGAFLDANRACHANVIEELDRFTVRFQRTESDPDITSEHFTYAQLQSLAGIKHKRRALPFGSRKPDSRYENMLRALGFELDEAKAYSLLIDEVDEGFLVTYQFLRPAQGFMVRKRMIFLDVSSIERVLDDAHDRRAEGRRGILTLLAG